MNGEVQKTKTVGQKIRFGVMIFLLAGLFFIVLASAVLIVQSFLPRDKMPGWLNPSIEKNDDMAPAINKGDFLFMRSADGGISEGDVVSYKTQSGFVLARVISVSDNELVVKGDKELAAFAATIQKSSVCGVWGGFKIPWLGGFLVWLQTPQGLCIFLVIILLADLLISWLMQLNAVKKGGDGKGVGVGIGGMLLLGGIMRIISAAQKSKNEGAEKR